MTCAPHDGGGTLATYRNRIFGFHEPGIEAVTRYVEAGGVEKTARAWRDTIAGLLDAGPSRGGRQPGRRVRRYKGLSHRPLGL